MVEFLLIRLVITPPAVSMPRESGATSRSSKSLHLLTLVAREDGCLHGCTVSDSLVRVDGFAELLPVEEVLEELLDLGDSG